MGNKNLHHQNPSVVYGDILSKPENERWEIIDGIPLMQARPSDAHQQFAGTINPIS